MGQEAMSDWLEYYQERMNKAARLLQQCYYEHKAGLFCGNGGSAADCEHFVGELAKEFKAYRGLSESIQEQLGKELGQKLRGGIPAISLVSQTGLLSAICNDVGFDYAYAQQVVAYAPLSKVLFCFSTSGNSTAVINAAKTAKAYGLTVVAFTGESGGRLKEWADICFNVDETDTYLIQEKHIRIYHQICLLAEDLIWKN